MTPTLAEFRAGLLKEKQRRKKAARALVAAYRSEIFNRTVEQRKGLK